MRTSTKVKYSHKLGWHYYFWLGKFKYLHGRFSSKEKAETLRTLYPSR